MFPLSDGLAVSTVRLIDREHGHLGDAPAEHEGFSLPAHTSYSFTR